MYKVINRRKNRALAPYIFFIAEVVGLGELSYLYVILFGTAIFGIENLALFILIAVSLYLTKTCLIRMYDVLDRNKDKSDYYTAQYH